MRWAVLLALAACGRIGFSSIDAGGPLAISPNSARSNLGTVTAFTATGGTPPYTFSLAGDGSIDAASGAYRAPMFPATAAVTVGDATGAIDTATITAGGDYLYYAGGYDTAAHAEVWRSSDGASWTQIGTLPTPRAFGAMFVYDDALYYIGGTNDLSTASENAVLRSTDGIAWTGVATLPKPLMCTGFAQYAGRMWLVGGVSPTNSFEQGAYSSSDGIAWRVEPSYPLAIHCVDLVPLHGELFALAGHASTGQTAAAYAYDGTSWAAQADVPAAGEYGGATAYAGKMWLAGGLGLMRRVVGTADGTTWEDVDPLALPRDYAQLAEFGGELWVIGGEPADLCHSPTGFGWIAAGVFPIAVEGGRLVQYTPH